MTPLGDCTYTVTYDDFLDSAFHTIPNRAMDEAGWHQLYSLMEPFARRVEM